MDSSSTTADMALSRIEALNSENERLKKQVSEQNKLIATQKSQVLELKKQLQASADADLDRRGKQYCSAGLSGNGISIVQVFGIWFCTGSIGKVDDCNHSMCFVGKSM